MLPLWISEAQSWRKRSMTHQCSHERAPASAHTSAHASVHESAHESWLSLCYNPIQRLPLECSRECSRGCPRKCTRSGLVVCHLVCFHLLCSLLIEEDKLGAICTNNIGAIIIPSTPKFLQYQRKILRGFNFLKITKNIFQCWSRIWPLLLVFVQYPRDSPKSAWELQKKNRCRNEFP